MCDISIQKRFYTFLFLYQVIHINNEKFTKKEKKKEGHLYPTIYCSSFSVCLKMTVGSHCTYHLCLFFYPLEHSDLL